MTNEELVQCVQAGTDVSGNMEKLYQQNRGMIGKAVKSLACFDDPEDLMQQGYLALYRAVMEYDPDAGASFSTFLMLVVRQDLWRYIDSKSSLIRLPEYKTNQIRQYKKLVSDLTLQTGSAPEDETVRKLMKLSPTVFKRLKTDILMSDVGSIDEEIRENLSLSEVIPDDQDIEQDVCDHLLLEEIGRVLDIMIGNLPDVEQIAVNTYLNNNTLSSVAETCGVSVQRMGQLRKQAVRKLQKCREVKYLRELCFQLYEDDIYASGIKGVGVGSFKNTFTSSTERVALDRLKLEEKITRKREKILAMMKEDQERYKQYIRTKNADSGHENRTDG